MEIETIDPKASKEFKNPYLQIEPHYIDHCKTYDITDDLTIQGFSRAGCRTGFVIKSKTKPLDFFLDSGMSSRRKAKNLFITHSHIDHTSCVSHLVPMRKHGHTNIFCLDVIKPLVLDHLYHRQKLNDCNANLDRERIGKNITWFTFTYGHSKIIQIPERSIYVKSIKCTHSVPSIGFSFFEVRKRLKKELRGLTGKEIKNLKDSGVDINEHYEVPLFAFMGDTNIGFLKEYQIDVPVLIIECTSFDNNPAKDYDDDTKSCDNNPAKDYGNDYDDEEKMIQRGHMHWTHILQLAKEHPQTKFVIIHFSQKYSNERIYKIEKNCELDNIMIIV